MLLDGEADWIQSWLNDAPHDANAFHGTASMAIEVLLASPTTVTATQPLAPALADHAALATLDDPLAAAVRDDQLTAYIGDGSVPAFFSLDTFFSEAPPAHAPAPVGTLWDDDSVYHGITDDDLRAVHDSNTLEAPAPDPADAFADQDGDEFSPLGSSEFAPMSPIYAPPSPASDSDGDDAASDVSSDVERAPGSKAFHPGVLPVGARRTAAAVASCGISDSVARERSAAGRRRSTTPRRAPRRRPAPVSESDSDSDSGDDQSRKARCGDNVQRYVVDGREWTRARKLCIPLAGNRRVVHLPKPALLFGASAPAGEYPAPLFDQRKSGARHVEHSATLGYNIEVCRNSIDRARNLVANVRAKRSRLAGELEWATRLLNAFNAEVNVIHRQWMLRYDCDEPPSAAVCARDLTLVFRWLVDSYGIETSMGKA